MEPTHQITRILHDEHVASLTLLNKLDDLLARSGPRKAPSRDEAGIGPTLNELSAAIGSEVSHHFAFEEAEMFPRLAEFGDGDIGDFLTDEHRTILPLGERVAELAAAATKDGFTPDGWQEFHRLGGELVERLMSHIQKEEMGLLPAIDDMLDDDTDRDLAMTYLAGR
ncbi:MAG: hemerythrin domain-containing protein [Alphaproteobacteria bacterium]|nr:hemerythrin domain-containing protein [Alphaproteobacteria bacterium]